MPRKTSTCRTFGKDRVATNDAPRLLYARKEAARLLSISIRSLDYLIAEGRLPTRRIGGRVLVAHDDLVRLANRGSSDTLFPAA